MYPSGVPTTTIMKENEVETNLIGRRYLVRSYPAINSNNKMNKYIPRLAILLNQLNSTDQLVVTVMN